jgi:hypothetical protein
MGDTPFESAVTGLATFTARQRATIAAHPDSIRDKLSSEELCLSSTDQHARALLAGGKAMWAVGAGAHLVKGVFDGFQAIAELNDVRPRFDRDHREAAYSHLRGAVRDAALSLGCHLLGQAWPRQRREHLSSRDEHLLREVETVRDAHRKGHGAILPPRRPRDGPPGVDAFVCRSPHDGSRWRAIRISRDD